MLFRSTNDDGLVEYTLTNDLKLKTPFNIDATVLLKKNIKNHFLFDSNSFSNPVQNLRVETIPLQIQKSIKVDNDFLKEKIRSSFQEIEGNIQKYLKAEFINKSDGLFSLEITCNDIIFNSKEISIDNEENIKTFKVQFTPVITFYNSKDNASLYSYTMSTQKATSFISFDHAYKKATKLINKDFEKIANEIANTIL